MTGLGANVGNGMVIPRNLFRSTLKSRRVEVRGSGRRSKMEKRKKMLKGLDYLVSPFLMYDRPFFVGRLLGKKYRLSGIVPHQVFVFVLPFWFGIIRFRSK